MTEEADGSADGTEHYHVFARCTVHELSAAEKQTRAEAARIAAIVRPIEQEEGTEW